MARPQKRGLDYFSLDVDIFSDRKIKILMARFGADGFTFYQYILCEIYKDEGYYLKTDNDFKEMSAADLNMSVEKIGLMLDFLLSRSLLDSKLFQSDKVLTSHGIQMRYQRAKQSAGQKTPIEVNEKFWILSESETQSFIKVRHNANYSGNNCSFSGNNSSFSRKNATKEKKEKEKKINKIDRSSVVKNLLIYLDTKLHVTSRGAAADFEYFLSSGMQEEVIKDAISEAEKRGKPYSYAQGIMRNRLEEGKLTMKDVERSNENGGNGKPCSEHTEDSGETWGQLGVTLL